MYLVGGWYDSWASNTTANFVALSQDDQGPGVPDHGAVDPRRRRAAPSHGQVSFGPAAAIPDPLAWRREWYDHWLKGIDNAVGKADPFATPGADLRDGHRRRPQDHGRPAGPRRLLARRARVAAGPHALHQLLSPARRPAFGERRRPERRRRTSFQFDPRHPVPTIGGNISSGDGIMLQGAWDQRGGPHVWNFKEPIPLSARNDVLVFQTEPLADDLEVTGEIAVKLWVSSSAVDTDFTAKLIDVYPPSPDFPGGFDLNIGDGILRARFRESLREEKLMEPGKIYPMTIKLYPTSNVFKQGPPHPRRHLQQQLPAVRREPQHGRAAERQPPHGDRHQHGLPRPRAPVAHRAAGDSGK